MGASYADSGPKTEGHPRHGSDRPAILLSREGSRHSTRRLGLLVIFRRSGPDGDHGVACKGDRMARVVHDRGHDGAEVSIEQGHHILSR